MSDDLNDGLDYELDLSDEELVENKPQEETSVKPQPVNGSKKRKRDDGLADKKRARMEYDIDRKVSLSKESAPEAIADYINDIIRKRNVDLSALELAELYFKKTDFRSTSDLADPRTLEFLAKFVNGRFGNMLPSSTPGKKNKKKKGKDKKKPETASTENEERKFIAVLSMSALRACDVHRGLREVPGSSLKLINKNKIDVDLKLVKTTWSRVLCCTPGRLQRVLASDDNELRADEIKIVLVDNLYLDKKKQNIWDIKETTAALHDLTAAGAKVYLY